MNKPIPYELKQAIEIYEQSLEMLPKPDFVLITILTIILFFCFSGFIVFSVMKNKKVITFLGLSAVIIVGYLGYTIYENLMSKEYKEGKKIVIENETAAIGYLKQYMREIPSQVIEVRKINYYEADLPITESKCENIFQEKTFEKLYTVKLSLDDEFFDEACGDVIVRRTLSSNATPHIKFKYLAPELQIKKYEKYNSVVLYLPQNYELESED